MLSKLIEKAHIQNWSTITLQTVILTSDILIYSKGNKNSFIILSGIIILSLFSLQVVSRRFLMFYPFQQYMSTPSQKIDTAILRLFLISSISLMFIGGINSDIGRLKEIESTLRSNLFWIIPILIPILPLSWHFIFDNLVRESFVEDMKKLSVHYAGKCPTPNCNNPYARFERKVLSQNCGQVVIECDSCNKKYEYKEPINLGY